MMTIKEFCSFIYNFFAKKNENENLNINLICDKIFYYRENFRPKQINF